jgi:dihydrofolate synthase/folylpolyglutamate synthase
MPIETYQQALAFWHSRINYEQRGMPADLRELRLDRMHELLERLGNPHHNQRIVHIAGSKGKGSTAAMLAAVLKAAGLRVGLFTSPHLSRVEERVQVNGQPISEAQLTALIREIEPAVLALEAHGAAPTFFEIVTALGFLHFATEHVDWMVLEVGLGGQFDSTNVCDPRLTVITSISFDHTQQLGNTLSSIAGEKAGILKPGVPLVHGVEADEARAVINAMAQRAGSSVCELGPGFGYRHEPGICAGGVLRPAVVSVCTAERKWPPLEVALLGRHQAHNAAVTVACVEELRHQGVVIPDEAVAAGLREVCWSARVEIVQTRPLVVLDCAHNVASVQALLETIYESLPTARRNLVFAGSRDKDLRGMLVLLRPHFERAFFTRYGGSQRGAEAAELAGIWSGLCGCACEIAASPAAAWEAARAAAAADEQIIIAGSVFLAGELRPVVMNNPVGTTRLSV